MNTRYVNIKTKRLTVFFSWFLISGYLIKRTGHMMAFSISFAMFAFRFLIYSIIRDPLWVLPVELLNGITFGLSYIAGISYSAKIAPVGSEDTVQGLFSMAFQGFGSSLYSSYCIRFLITYIRWSGSGI